MNDSYSSLPALFYDACFKGESFYFAFKKNKEWIKYSGEKLLEKLEYLYLAFRQHGITKGTAVGIIANSSPEWILSDLAIQICGGITVPLLPLIASENFLYEKEDARISVLIIDEKEKLEPEIQKILSAFSQVFQIETTVSKDTNTFFFEELFLTGKNLKTNDSFSELKKNIEQIQSEDIFSIIYTSGSMGRPKGVPLTHRNILSQFQALHPILKLNNTQDKALSVLPVAHIFERMVIYFFAYEKIPVYFGKDPRLLKSLLNEVKPTLMTVVPRLLERLYEGILQLTRESKFIRKWLLGHAIRFALTNNPKNNPKNKKKFYHYFFHFLVYKKILKQLNPEFRYLISGSSALNKNICRFFLNIGIPICEGYGMTECAPVIALNTEESAHIGSVGKVLPGVEIRFGEHQEILVRGENVFKGYYNYGISNELFFTEDGFFKTGDCGYLNPDGYLFLSGRLKEMLKTSTGKYVSPLPIENALALHPLIEAACIIANNRKFVSALIFIRKEVAMQLLNVEKEVFSLEKASLSRRIQATVKKEIEKTNNHLNYWEQIKKWIIIPETPSVENGLLTPTLKLKRNVVQKKYEEQIELLYSDSK